MPRITRRMFFYGTLMDRFTAADATKVGAAVLHGYTLLSVAGNFPAAVQAEGQQVRGQVWDVAEALVPHLDMIEGTARGLYNRERVIVRTEDGAEHDVEAYLWEGRGVRSDILFPCGESWLDHLAAQDAEDAEEETHAAR